MSIAHVGVAVSSRRVSIFSGLKSLAGSGVALRVVQLACMEVDPHMYMWLSQVEKVNSTHTPNAR